MRISRWLQEGRPIGMERIDEVTLQVSAEKPLGQLMHALSGVDKCALPKHALKDLHPRYNPKATYEKFRERTTNAQEVMRPGLPRMTAWIPVQWIRGQRITYERNPYYWKVDTAGNQLPYADRLEFQVIPNPQVIAMKFINGEIDVFGRYSRVDFFPMLKKNAIESGTIRVLLAGPTRGPALYLNWDAPNPQLRAAFRLKKVRMALSHAINRDEVNELIYHGLLDPGGYAYVPQSPYHSEEDFRRYATHDQNLANQYLDDAGFTDSDADGYREFRDGSRFELTVDVSTSGRSGVDGTKIGELIVDYWTQIGVRTNLNAALKDIIWPRRTTGEFEVHLGLLEGPKDPTERPQHWSISQRNAPFWHQKASEEGPAWLFEATRQMQRAITTVDPGERRAAIEEVGRLHSVNVPVIALGSTHMVWGVNARLGNVPEEIMPDDEYRGWSRPVFHEQLFIRDE
jgi:peptide/nickel transport system substrate-binding protein